jgi:hypothetical protein
MATRQIRERVKQHSLLATDPAKGLALAFDHEDFQDFYLGEGLGRCLAASSRSDLYSLLSANILSPATVEQSIQYLIRANSDLVACVEQIKAINSGESGFSFCKENCGLLTIRLAECLSSHRAQQVYTGMYFGADSLMSRTLRLVSFEECHFQPSRLSSTSFEEVHFLNSEFERLDLPDENVVSGCTFVDCRIDALLLVVGEDYLFNPSQINSKLLQRGAIVVDSTNGLAPSLNIVEDERLKMLHRFFRIFLRTTQVNEDVIRLRLGSAVAGKFFEDVMPHLRSTGILEEVTWDGRGIQRRYRLAVPMASIHKALENSQGSFDHFVEAFSS